MSPVILMRAAALPYPGEAGVAVPGHVPHRPPVRQDAAERACTGTTRAGAPCKGRPGDDGLCAAHKES